MSISEACDEILNSDILDHEFGLPKLNNDKSPISANSIYYETNKNLTKSLSKLVYLDRIKALEVLSDSEIDTKFSEINSIAPLNDLSTHTACFRDGSLLNDYLTMALSVLRSIHHDGDALAPAEKEIASNLSKLYSKSCQSEISSVHNGMAKSQQVQQLQKEHGTISGEIDHVLTSVIGPKLQICAELHDEYYALENTYKNHFESSALVAALLSSPQMKRLRSSVLVLSKKLAAISILCDLVPNLILCLPSDWHNDETLLNIMMECQDIAEKADPFIVAFSNYKLLTPEEILRVDYKELAEALL